METFYMAVFDVFDMFEVDVLFVNFCIREY